jgi:hypothetical protein
MKPKKDTKKMGNILPKLGMENSMLRFANNIVGVGGAPTMRRLRMTYTKISLDSFVGKKVVAVDNMFPVLEFGDNWYSWQYIHELIHTTGPFSRWEWEWEIYVPKEGVGAMVILISDELAAYIAPWYLDKPKKGG